MKKKVIAISFLLVVLLLVIPFIPKRDADHSEEVHRPVAYTEHEDDDDDDAELQEAKVAPWTIENAARHQKIITQYLTKPTKGRGIQSYANGALLGEWRNRGAKNMPGAFKFAEMLDGTDTVYGVTHNHYAGEYNSKSYIFKGTVYNPKSGTKGDDFVRLTGHWPNRYQNLLVLKVNGSTRLIAHIENGPLYYSDDQGLNWELSNGLPSVVQSSAMNRQDGNRIYVTDGSVVYSSTNGGESFTAFQNFNESSNAFLYSPRYAIQPDADKVYLVRSGSFYALDKGSSSFTFKGTFTSSHGTKALSIGGDSRKLYVTENSNYWVSTNGGTSWTSKSPKGNWYGDRTGKMSAGKFLCVNPEDANNVIGGYAQPVFSTTGLDSDVSTTAGWGGYQNGTNLSTEAYYDRIRFNYHPDFQASHFFYNSSGDLFSIHCTDGGLFVSYKVFKDHSETAAYDNGGFSSAHFINITTLNTTCPLIYRDNLFTGYKDETHIIYSTQDQGSQSIIPGTSGDALDFYQSIGGDGPPLKSVDGRWVWKWNRQGKEVVAPVEMYDASGNMRSAAAIKSLHNNRPKASFTESSNVGWVQVYIDRDAPDTRMWLLSNRLDRATVNGSFVAASSISKGTGHQVCAFAQAHNNPDIVWFLQEGKVYKSTNRGDSFDNGTATPFAKTSNRQNMGSGWALPSDDKWVLFVGPSSNGVGAILTKDGGATFTDVTGDFPSGDDFQASTIEGTPDGKFVFVGTDIGPWVFVVATEKWYPIGDGAAYFNAMDMEFIESTNTMRFASWGTGVWDFSIKDGSIDPFLTLKSPNGGEVYSAGDIVTISWNSYLDGDVKISLLNEGAEVQTLATVPASQGSYEWSVGATVNDGDAYSIQVASIDNASLIDESDSSFKVLTLMKLAQKHLGIISTDSEEPGKPATNVLDGDGSTFWHTEWSQSKPEFPHEIIMSCDTSVKLAALEYTGREDGSSNGHVKAYEVFIAGSDDLWVSVASGELSGSGTTEKIIFNTFKPASQIKFVAKSEVGGSYYASASEINLYYVGGGTAVEGTFVVSDKSRYSIQLVRTNHISVNVPEQSAYTLSIIGANGRVLHSEKGIGPVRSLNLAKSGISTGFYIVKLQSSLGVLTKRVRIE